MEKTIRNLTSTVRLLEEQGVADLDYVSMDIGYDGRVYLLFSSGAPERINGMFVDTAANAEYTALILTPDWQSGAIEETEKLALGKHAMNFQFLRPVSDGLLLLLGSRCMYSGKDGPEKNAVFVDPEGNVLRELTFGDGIADCIVKADGTIVTSYFDEGVMGNYGWKKPIGSSGLVAWTAEGEILWRPDRDILDCYAMNVDEEGDLWYYYYTDFLLVHTDGKTETEYEPAFEGADRFAVIDGGRTLIMNGGYDDEDTFYVSRIGDKNAAAEQLTFTGSDGAAIEAVPVSFLGAKAILLTPDGDVSFMDLSR